MTRALKASLLLRLLLGGVFLYAGWTKLQHPYIFAQTVNAYEILPGRTVSLVAIILPWLEVLSAACLLLGFLARSASFLLATLNLSFCFAISSALLTGKKIDCGCFGNSSWSQISVWHLVLDIFLLGASCWLFYFGPGSMAFDIESGQE